MFIYQFMSDAVDAVSGAEGEDFDPHKARNVAKLLTYSETLLHLLKGALGVGILVMPFAVHRLGIVYGSIGITLIGLFAVYSLHVLIYAKYEVCKRNKRGYMSYPKCMSRAIKGGPLWFRRNAFFFYVMADGTLLVSQLGLCAVYIVFTALNLQQVAEHHKIYFDTRLWILFIFPAQLLINLTKDFKVLTFLSTFSNFVLFFALMLLYYYLTAQDITLDDDKFKVKFIGDIPIFISTTLFALEAVGIILALEYNIEKPEQFTGFSGVLTIGMIITILIFVITGVTGYLKYGEDIAESITLNLPSDEKKAQTAKITFATTIYFSIPLQNYVAWRISWLRMKKNIKMCAEKPVFWNYFARVILVIIPFALAGLIPDLLGFIVLFGSLCISLIVFVFPGIMDACVWYPNRYGIAYYKLIRDFFLIIMGIIFLISGLLSSVEIIVTNYYTKPL